MDAPATSSGYPGFAAFPYREYSEVFFGADYKVLRGGSFGTDRVACRGTFRNWDYPIRRQIFAGFRCARDAAPGARSAERCAATWPTSARRCRWRELLFDPPHSLVRQSWAPRDMRGGGTVNADGFGVGWYPSTGRPPVRYRRAEPIWTDADLPTLAAVDPRRRGAGRGPLGHRRHAGRARPPRAPFAEGRWLFSHNGRGRAAGRTRWPRSPRGCR